MPDENEIEYYYRVVANGHYPEDTGLQLISKPTMRLQLFRYRVRHTRCGVVLTEYGIFINHKWKKRYAFPTIEEAVEQFKILNQYKRDRLIEKLRDTNRALELIESPDEIRKTWEDTIIW